MFSCIMPLENARGGFPMQEAIQFEAIIESGIIKSGVKPLALDMGILTSEKNAGITSAENEGRRNMLSAAYGQ